jgi:hypothetical protein
MKIVKDIFDAVFSFGGFVAVAGALIVFIFGNLILQDNVKKAFAEATTKACYDGGLIKVDTDAGFYCVAPANLVKVEVK